MGKISDIKNFRYVHIFEHSGCYNADTDEKQEWEKTTEADFYALLQSKMYTWRVYYQKNKR